MPFKINLVMLNIYIYIFINDYMNIFKYFMHTHIHIPTYL